MILKGSQRSGGASLGQHLLKTEENEHVELHEVRGFVSQSMMGALKEAQAISKATRCKQYLFSLSLSPPETEAVRVGVFEKAIDTIEERLGLTGQPRIIVFHEKEGRRHCHAVWSRIDAETMKAKQLSFFKNNLREISRQLYIENGWKMPKGLMNSKARDPRNFSLEEWQQAKRTSHDPRSLKEMTQECWAVSDSLSAFQKAIEERGLFLAKGDRRGHLLVTLEGEAFALSRMIGKRSADVTQKLGTANALPALNEVRAMIGSDVLPRLSHLIRQVKDGGKSVLGKLNDEKYSLQQRHREERNRLDVHQTARRRTETQERALRFRKGAAGLWDRVTGEHGKTKKRNEIEAFFASQRDRKQRDDLVIAQLAERQVLQTRIRQTRRQTAECLLSLYRDASRLRVFRSCPQNQVRDAFQRNAHGSSSQTRRPQNTPRRPSLDLER